MGTLYIDLMVTAMVTIRGDCTHGGLMATFEDLAFIAASFLAPAALLVFLRPLLSMMALIATGLS